MDVKKKKLNEKYIWLTSNIACGRHCISPPPKKELLNSKHTLSSVMPVVVLQRIENLSYLQNLKQRLKN